MKILLVSQSMNSGGAERVMANLANEWCKNNDVTLLVFGKPCSFYSLSKAIHFIGLNLQIHKSGARKYIALPLIELKRYKAILKEIIRLKPDFVLSFCFLPNLFISFASRKNRKSDVSYFVSERADPLLYPRWKRIINCIAYKWSDGVICQNEYSADYFSRKLHKNNVFVCPNPVDFDDIPQKQTSERKKEIVSVGRLINQKNHKLLIEAFHSIQNKYDDYILKIWGDGHLRENLEKRIRELKMEEKIFLMGVQSHVMNEVAKASVFVLSSDYEGFPNVLIEAMGAYMPVISSDFNTGIARKLINDGENGYLFRVGDAHELSACMEKMLSRSDEYAEIGKVNHDIASAYEKENISKLWLTEIKKKLKGN